MGLMRRHEIRIQALSGQSAVVVMCSDCSFEADEGVEGAALHYLENVHARLLSLYLGHDCAMYGPVPPWRGYLPESKPE